MWRRSLFIIAAQLPLVCTQAQDLLSQLPEEPPENEYAAASFKTTRVINAHSLENTGHGVLDFKIQHRFGELSSGRQQAFGLDQATVRLGLDYGVTDRLMVGGGRSSYQKTVDAFAKYKFLRQCDAGCKTPITLAVIASVNLNGQPEEDLPWFDANTANAYSHRLTYAFQAMIGRKFNENTTVQIMPGLLHRNLVRLTSESNDALFVGIAGRQKISKRVAINAEYYYVPEDQIDFADRTNSVSLGFDIETGGHVFQLHVSNSTGMFERAYIGETTGNVQDGDILFGFNVSRVFTLHKPGGKGVAEENW
jgi:Membrane bound beta barrel domain (DUF5777)